jgi:hypothetical protein
MTIIMNLRETLLMLAKKTITPYPNAPTLEKTQENSLPYHECQFYNHLLTIVEKAMSLLSIASTNGFLSVSQMTPFSGISAVARY